MSETLLQALNLSKFFGETKAVIDLNLDVHMGEIYGLVGPDGAGKTTLIRMLVGAMLPDEGEVTIRGYNMLAESDQAREQLGYLSQRFSLYEDLTVLENLRFFAEVRGFSPAEWRPRIMETLEFVGLAEFIDRRAGQLSGGMKQKLGLATALVHQPILLLLDEPTAGLDPQAAYEFQRLLETLRDEGKAILMSTHDIFRAREVSDTIGILNSGRLVMKESTRDLAGEDLEQLYLQHMAGHRAPSLALTTTENGV